MAKMGTIAITERGMELRTIEDVYRIAKAIATSQLCPSGWNESDVLLVLLNAAEIGLRPLQALASSYIVNAKVSLYADAPKALVEASGLLEDYEEHFDGKPYDDDYTAVVTSKRKGRKPLTTIFSVSDAKEAGIWNISRQKNGKEVAPWVLYKKRMLMWRARGYNLKDNFPDVFKGTAIRELEDEGQGFEHAKPAKVVEPNFAPQFKEMKEAVNAAAPAESNVMRPSRSEVGPTRTTKAAPVTAEAVPVPTTASSPVEEPPVAPPPTKPAAPPQPPKPPKQAPPDVYDELRSRLDADKITDGQFVAVMADFGFQPEPDGRLSEKAIRTALKDWNSILSNLPPV
jgi:hypothetical protein